MIEIEGIKIVDSHVGQQVLYKEYAHGGVLIKEELGRISSFDSRHIWIKFKSESGQLCNPEFLTWVTKPITDNDDIPHEPSIDMSYFVIPPPKPLKEQLEEEFVDEMQKKQEQGAYSATDDRHFNGRQKTAIRKLSTLIRNLLDENSLQTAKEMLGNLKGIQPKKQKKEIELVEDEPEDNNDNKEQQSSDNSDNESETNESDNQEENSDEFGEPNPENYQGGWDSIVNPNNSEESEEDSQETGNENSTEYEDLTQSNSNSDKPDDLGLVGSNDNQNPNGDNGAYNFQIEEKEEIETVVEVVKQKNKQYFN